MFASPPALPLADFCQPTPLCVPKAPPVRFVCCSPSGPPAKLLGLPMPFTSRPVLSIWFAAGAPAQGEVVLQNLFAA
eukprot:1316258-Amphidinium_carterae.1